MAKPIASTPTLQSKDYEKFIREVLSQEDKKASKKEIERGKRLFESMEKKLEDAHIFV